MSKAIKKKTLLLSIILLLTISALNMNMTSVSAAESPYIAVVPPTTTGLGIGESFMVSIYTDYSGSDVWGWQFTLTYNPTIIQGVNVTNGDLIHPDKSVYAIFEPGEFDNVAGKLSLTLAYFYYQPPYVPPTTTSGPGTLANVTFTVVGTGGSNITLGMSPPGQTQLKAVDHNIIDAVINPKHIVHGYFRNLEETPIHDVAVISVTPSTTRVKLGDFVNITVVVRNEGNFAETFAVEVKYLRVGAKKDTAIKINETIMRDFAPNAQETLNSSWEITSLRTGNYTIIAIASLPNDMNTLNNEQESTEIVTVESGITPFPIEVILVVLAILAGITILAIYNARRRKKRKLE